MTDLTDRTILVTGASSGIGLAIVQRLAATGARVIAHANTNPDGARRAVASFPSGRAHVVQADLGDPAGAGRLWEHAEAWAGRIDVVVLNAAIMPRIELDDTDERWQTVMEQALQVNTLSQLTLIRRALAHFAEHDGGTIVGLSSWVTQRGSGHANLVAYAASKAATAAAIKTIARTHADRNVLAYLIAPGAVDTGMSATASADRGGRDEFLRALAMGEMVPPEEIAELVALLVSGRVRHLSGATLDINGASYIR
ncbi:SDR family oxidoreductase [Microbacterium sp. 1P10UB]|uniref:SDR family NAD(P)-dependent oxidoreductase n=1 Tax=unclassified Microbacterium TaxID=2609290 RepID=UPI0039A1B264